MKKIIKFFSLYSKKYNILIIVILLLGFYLRVAYLNENMEFIADQGWFYLSARDMILTGNIPLVGIESSHPWLHQGALWTYILGITLWVFNFHPLSGGYISILIDCIAVFAIYKIGSILFTKRIGLISSLIYASSVVVILHGRMPYHTNPIPLFSILAIYCLYKWTTGARIYFPVLIFILGILYNFELSAFLFAIVISLILIFGVIRKKRWAIELRSPKIILLSIIGFIFSMLPMLIYDISHGFPQTIKFVIWIFYRIFVFFGYPPINPISQVNWGDMFKISLNYYTWMIFPFSTALSLIIFILSFYYAFIIAKKFNYPKNITIILITNLVLILGFFISKTPSGAYLPMMYPGLIMMTALLFDGLIKKYKIIGISLLISYFLLNSYYFISNNYTLSNQPGGFSQRLSAAKYIVKEAEGRNYNLIGKGVNSQFASFTMNHEYLTWWLGHGPSKKPEKLKFTISEEAEGFKIWHNGNYKLFETCRGKCD